MVSIKKTLHDRSSRYQQTQCGIVSNALIANERHCIDLGTAIIVGTNKTDVLDLGHHGASAGRMFMTGNLALPVPGGAFVIPRIEDKGIAAGHLTVAKYQDTTNIVGNTIP